MTSSELQCHSPTAVVIFRTAVQQLTIFYLKLCIRGPSAQNWVTIRYDTIRYDTVDYRARKSWRDGQQNLAHGPESSETNKIREKTIGLVSDVSTAYIPVAINMLVLLSLCISVVYRPERFAESRRQIARVDADIRSYCIACLSRLIVIYESQSDAMIATYRRVHSRHVYSTFH